MQNLRNANEEIRYTIQGMQNTLESQAIFIIELRGELLMSKEEQEEQNDEQKKALAEKHEGWRIWLQRLGCMF
jgi:NAD-dependent DNA ligase